MWRLIGIGGGILLILVITGAVGWKIIGKSEGYRAEEQTFNSFEPHFFIGGCARYDAYRKPDIEPIVKTENTEVKK